MHHSYRTLHFAKRLDGMEHCGLSIGVQNGHQSLHEMQFVPRGEAGLEVGPMQEQRQDIVAPEAYAKQGSQRS